MTQPFQLMNKGIQMSLKLVPAHDLPGAFIALLQCYSGTHSHKCGIFMQRIHDDNYIRVGPHVIRISSFADLQFETVTLFSKSELAGITWQKADMCSTITGFRFHAGDNERWSSRGLRIKKTVS
jgi:hypothetical protein